MRIFSVFFLLINLFCFSSLATADEMRVGYSYQDVKIQGLGGIKGKENGNGLALEYVTDEVKVLDFALKPKAYVGGIINLSGDTSYGGAGLLWDTKLFGDVNGEVSFGLIAHNGELEIASPGSAMTAQEAMELQKLNAENIEFGSRLLFRTQFGLGYDLSEDMSLQFYYDHLSHGKILSSGSNEGLDAYGVKFAKRF